MAKHTNNDTSCAQAPRATHCRATWLCALATAALLAACGGGGGGGQQTSTPVTSPATTSPTSPVVVNNYELQTTVPAPTYAAGSWQEFVFNYINERRSQCGFGKLAQDTSLDKAAQGHAEYLARLVADVGASAYGLEMHEQIDGRPLFTGKTLGDRIKAAGYKGLFATEQIAGGVTRSDATSRQAYVLERLQALLSTVYHMDLMISYTRSIGLGLKAYTATENPSNEYRHELLVINPGWNWFEQANKADVVSYPCEGTTDVSEGLYGELPDPTAGKNLNMPVGPAIMVVSPFGTTLKVQTASVVPMARLNGTPLGSLPSFNSAAANPAGILILDQANDKLVSDQSKTFLLPHKPLEAGVTYRVELGLTVDGQTKTKIFTFSTRKQASL